MRALQWDRRATLHTSGDSYSPVGAQEPAPERADTRAAGTVGPIPSFPANSRWVRSLFSSLSALVSADENSWDSGRRRDLKAGDQESIVRLRWQAAATPENGGRSPAGVERMAREPGTASVRIPSVGHGGNLTEPKQTATPNPC